MNNPDRKEGDQEPNFSQIFRGELAFFYGLTFPDEIWDKYFPRENNLRAAVADFLFTLWSCEMNVRDFERCYAASLGECPEDVRKRAEEVLASYLLGQRISTPETVEGDVNRALREIREIWPFFYDEILKPLSNP